MKITRDYLKGLIKEELQQVYKPRVGQGHYSRDDKGDKEVLAQMKQFASSINNQLKEYGFQMDIDRDKLILTEKNNPDIRSFFIFRYGKIEFEGTTVSQFEE